MATGKKKKSLVDRIYDFLCSVKLSLGVLIALALTSIFGTVIQQGKDASTYLGLYGETWAKIIDIFDLGDMYYSWWFKLLLSLLMVNITFCSIKRIPKALRLMKDSDPVYDNRPVAIHERFNATSKESVEEVAKKAEELLSSKVGAVKREEKDGSIYLMTSKGKFSRMGVYITHFSLFLFGLGAIVGSATGFKGGVNIIEGRTATTVYDRALGKEVPLGFDIRCDDFELELYAATGRPKDYKSTLVIIEDGKEVAKKTIEVNSPLIHNGYYFYQSSYGQVGVRGVTLSVAGLDRRYIHVNKVLGKDSGLVMPDGSKLVIRDMWKDPAGRAPDGVMLGLMRDGKLVTTGRVFAKEVSPNMWPVGSYLVKVNEIDWWNYTGLQVARDPGVPIIWAGCFIITLGLMISFFMSHRRVWARISEKDGKTNVEFAGNASRNRISFERWFEVLCKDAQETFEK